MRRWSAKVPMADTTMMGLSAMREPVIAATLLKQSVFPSELPPNLTMSLGLIEPPFHSISNPEYLF